LFTAFNYLITVKTQTQVEILNIGSNTCDTTLGKFGIDYPKFVIAGLTEDRAMITGETGCFPVGQGLISFYQDITQLTLPPKWTKFI
jgi:hypothetical protein